MYAVTYLLNVKNSLEENIRRGSGNNEVISDSVVQSIEEPTDEPTISLPSIPPLPSLPTIPMMDFEPITESKGRRGSKTEPKRRRGGPFDGPYDFQVPTLPDPPKPEQDADLWTAAVSAGLLLSPVITIPTIFAQDSLQRTIDWYSLTFGIDTAS